MGLLNVTAYEPQHAKIWSLFGLQNKHVLIGCHISLSSTWKERDWQHVNDYSLTMDVKVMIFCTETSQVTRVRRITMTQIQKTSHLNIVIQLIPQRKIQDPTFCR